jgi:NhaA family Na+:H+ antiporter
MAIFFSVDWFRIRARNVSGELSSLKNAALPIFGALGGMVVRNFLLLNIGTITQNGAGIPMATDIAFAIEFYLFWEVEFLLRSKYFDRACRN